MRSEERHERNELSYERGIRRDKRAEDQQEDPNQGNKNDDGEQEQRQSYNFMNLCWFK